MSCCMATRERNAKAASSQPAFRLTYALPLYYLCTHAHTPPPSLTLSLTYTHSHAHTHVCLHLLQSRWSGPASATAGAGAVPRTQLQRRARGDQVRGHETWFSLLCKESSSRAHAHILFSLPEPLLYHLAVYAHTIEPRPQLPSVSAPPHRHHRRPLSSPPPLFKPRTNGNSLCSTGLVDGTLASITSALRGSGRMRTLRLEGNTISADATLDLAANLPPNVQVWVRTG